MIAGEIVIESLFGRNFNELRFGNNTPLQEIQGVVEDFLK